MLGDRTEASRMSGESDAATYSWRQKRNHPWAHTWFRNAVDSAITASMWDTDASFTTSPLYSDYAEARWKRFLLLASRWGARRGFASTARPDSVAQK